MTNTSSSPSASFNASSNECATKHPEVNQPHCLVSTMVFRLGNGLPSHLSIDSCVFLPTITVCPKVNSLKRLRSVDKCQRMPPALPITLLFFAIATIMEIFTPLYIVYFSFLSIFFYWQISKLAVNYQDILKSMFFMV